MEIIEVTVWDHGGRQAVGDCNLILAHNGDADEKSSGCLPAVN